MTTQIDLTWRDTQIPIEINGDWYTLRQALYFVQRNADAPLEPIPLGLPKDQIIDLRAIVVTREGIRGPRRLINNISSFATITGTGENSILVLNDNQTGFNLRFCVILTAYA